MSGAITSCAALRDGAWSGRERLPAASHGPSKVPEIAAMFWVVKIAATTLGETGGDAVSMSLQLGYALSTVVFFAMFAASFALQFRARAFHPALYWTVVLSTTTAGTTMADFADRSLGIGYFGGTLILAGMLALVLVAWRVTLGSISASAIRSKPAEAFYWATILFSNTLGTALGDYTADRSGLGYEGGALVFASLLLMLLALYLLSTMSRVLLFWLAFVMTRPLGATVGDLLTKPRAHGGLALDRTTSSAVLGIFIILCVLVMPRRQGGTRSDPRG